MRSRWIASELMSADSEQKATSSGEGRGKQFDERNNLHYEKDGRIA